MLKEVGQLILSGLNGSHGASGRLQGACLAVALGLGCLRAVRVGFSVDWFFWRQFIRPAKDLKKYGSWAAVTGATDGIGRAYCDVLAKQGLNVLLISRTESRLKAAAEEITAAFGVETKTLAIDLVEAGNSPYEGPQWQAFKSAINSLEIGVFINNAGQGMDPFFHHQLSNIDLDNLVAINCASIVKVTHAVLPSMVARGRGAIVNISSAGADVAVMPMLALYAATKKFVDHFSGSLAEEYRSKGIDIQCQSPAMVSTKMSKIPPSLDAPAPSAWAAAAVRHIGYEPHAVPYFYHALNRPMMQHMPKPILVHLIKNAMIQHHKKEQDKNAAATKLD